MSYKYCAGTNLQGSCPGHVRCVGPNRVPEIMTRPFHSTKASRPSGLLGPGRIHLRVVRGASMLKPFNSINLRCVRRISRNKPQLVTPFYRLYLILQAVAPTEGAAITSNRENISSRLVTPTGSPGTRTGTRCPGKRQKPN